MSWRGWMMLALLAGAIATGWSVFTRSRPAAQAGTTLHSDYVLHDFQIVALDAQGQESFTLRAPQMRRDPADKSMELATPVFLVPDDGKYWEVHAQRGRVDAGGDTIRLHGGVVATSPAGTDPVRIESSRLDVQPGAKRATSPDQVVVTQPGLTMRGRGLVADLQRRTATFSSDVHTRYVPNSR